MDCGPPDGFLRRLRRIPPRQAAPSYAGWETKRVRQPMVMSRVSDGIRTRDVLIHSQEPKKRKGASGKEVASDPTLRLLAGCSDQPLDADLQRVLDSWPALPGHIKAAVLALIESAGKGASR